MKLPEEVSRLLTIFRTAYGQEMYVVGGAVRDTVLNKPINDYDIFLQRDSTDKEIDREELRILSQRTGFLFSSTGSREYLGECFVNMSKEGPEIEVMISNKTIFEYIEDFPVNVSKVFLKEDGTIHKHDDFIEYEKTKELVFDFSNAGGTEEKHIAYEEKIRAKFR